MGTEVAIIYFPEAVYLLPDAAWTSTGGSCGETETKT